MLFSSKIYLSLKKDEYIKLYNNTLPNPLNYDIYKDVNEYLDAPRNSYLEDAIKKYGDPVNTKGLDLPLFSKEILDWVILLIYLTSL